MDNVDEAEGPISVAIGQNELPKLLYTSLFNLNTPFDLVSFLFGILLIIFGLIGYLSKGSLISLIASVSIAILIIIGSYLTVKINFYWSFLTLASTLILFIIMAQRFYKSTKFYPSGLLSLISFLIISFLTTRFILFYKNKNS